MFSLPSDSPRPGYFVFCTFFSLAWGHGGRRGRRTEKLIQISVQALEETPGAALSLTSEILSVHYARVYCLAEKDNFSLECGIVSTHCPQNCWGGKKKSHIQYPETST